MNVNHFFHRNSKMENKEEDYDEDVISVPIKKKKVVLKPAIRRISGNYDKKGIEKKHDESDISEEETMQKLSLEEEDDDISVCDIVEDDEEEEDVFNFESEIIEEKKPTKKSAKKTEKKTEKKTLKKISKKVIEEETEDIVGQAKEILGKPSIVGTTSKSEGSRVITNNSKKTVEYINSLERELPCDTYSMDEFDLSEVSFTGAVVNCAEVEGVELERKNFFAVISSIYEYLENYESIIQHTKMNVKLGKETGRGFVYLQELDVSVQGVTANKAIQEIFEQVLGNSIDIRLDVSTKEARYIFVNE